MNISSAVIPNVQSFKEPYESYVQYFLSGQGQISRSSKNRGAYFQLDLSELRVWLSQRAAIKWRHLSATHLLVEGCIPKVT